MSYFRRILRNKPAFCFASITLKTSAFLFLDISVTRDRSGALDTNICRKPTHGKGYLNFKSKHLLEHKSAVVNVPSHRTDSLVRSEDGNVWS